MTRNATFTRDGMFGQGCIDSRDQLALYFILKVYYLQQNTR